MADLTDETSQAPSTDAAEDAPELTPSEATPPPKRDTLTLALAIVAAVSVLCFLILAIHPQWFGLGRHQAAEEQGYFNAPEPPFEVQLAIAEQTVQGVSLKDNGRVEEAIVVLENAVTTYPNGGRYLAEPYLALGWCYRKKEAQARQAGQAMTADTARDKALQYFDLAAQVAPAAVQEATDAKAAADKIRAEMGLAASSAAPDTKQLPGPAQAPATTTP